MLPSSSKSFFSINERTIPSLDGLRAVSIILVIISHIAVGIFEHYSTGFTRLQSIVQSFFVLGNLGVTIFFVISGFLITTLLIKDTNVNLKRFYFRRFFRIFPPFYFYLLVILAIGILKGMTGFTNLISSATYTRNYIYSDYGIGTWTLGHTWSLAVEEQFYIIFPILLAVIGRKSWSWFIWCVVILCPIIRYIQITINPSLSIEFKRFESVADALAIGCLLAVYRSRLHKSPTYSGFLKKRYLSYLLPVSIVFITWMSKLPAYVPRDLFALFGITIQHSLIALLLDYVITNNQYGAGKVLNWRPVAFIGAISYSLYLWQQLFINPYLDLAIGWKLLFTFLAALFSFYLIEQPVLRFRKRIEAGWKNKFVPDRISNG